MTTSGIAPIPPVTTDDWLRVLTRRMDLRRLGVLLLRSYSDGNAPLPEMSRETRQSWMYFQRRSRTNWGKLIIDSVVNRVKPIGITIAGDNESAEAKQAQAIWRNSRMNSVFKEWLRYGTTFGQSYLTVWTRNTGPDAGKTIITADSPETMIVVTDPLQHWRPVAALRVWRNMDEARDYAIVWTPGAWQQYVRPTYTRIELKIIPSKWIINLAEGAWTPVGQPNGQSNDATAPIPVVVYNNPGGSGDYELHLDVINRVNAGILERLVVTAIQAFRQRAITGGQLPEVDEHGNRIKYEEVFANAPGALWNLPEGLELWESQLADIPGLLSANKEDIRQLSAATSTPLPMLMPDNTNTSAEGAKATEAAYLFRCMDRLDEAKFGIESCMDLAMRVDGATLADDQFVEVQFKDPQLITLTEKYQAALGAHNCGESWHSIERNILGYSPDQIAQDDIDRAHEALMAATMPPLPTTVQERLTGQAPGAGPMTDVQTQTGPKPNGQQPQPKPSSPAQNTKKVAMTNGGTQPGGRK
jgi:hypothetical protein